MIFDILRLLRLVIIISGALEKSDFVPVQTNSTYVNASQ